MRIRLKSFLNKNWLIILTAIAAGLFCAMFVNYYSQDVTLLYKDARSRLLISRRVIDSLTPGLTQFGGVWPPLPQILFELTIWNNFFFYSGLSGSLISIISATIAVFLFTKMVYEISQRKVVALIGTIAFIFNPSFLYMTTTAMTETLFISILVATVYCLWKWLNTNEVIFLSFAGLMITFASLTRYDGWFLALFTSVIISIMVFLKRKSLTEVEGNLILFATIGFFGVVGWLAYNQLIYGNMFRFIIGAGSATSQAAGSISAALTKYNLGNSVYAYFSAASLNVGVISLIVFIVALIVSLIKRTYQFILPILVFTSSIWFNIISLYFGQSEILTTHFPPFDLYNVRFGLLVLPLIALSYASLSYYFNKLGKIIIFILLGVQIIWLNTYQPITLQEAIRASQLPKGIEQKDLSLWLKEHPADGLVLISALSNDSLIFDANIPLKEVIYEGSGDYWKASISNPKFIVERIIVSPEKHDPLWDIIKKDPKFLEGFEKAYTMDNFLVFDNKTSLAKNKGSNESSL